MILTRKHDKAIGEAVEALKRKNKEVTQASLSAFIMTQVVSGDYLAGKLGKLTTGMISEYCRIHEIPQK